MVIIKEKSTLKESVKGVYGKCSAWVEINPIDGREVVWTSNNFQKSIIPLDAALAIVDLAKKTNLVNGKI
jgi:hypothetical protein